MRAALLLVMASMIGCAAGRASKLPARRPWREAAERQLETRGRPAPACRDAAACHAACEAGDAASCSELGRLFEASGRALPAAQRWRRACDLGDAAACGAAAALHARAGADSFDIARAAGLYQRGCAGGDAGSCAELGHWYEVGRSVDPDAARAADLARRARWLYELACDGGDGMACHQLGLVRTAKSGLEPLVAAFQRACDLGVADDCGFVGRMYQHLGRGRQARAALSHGCEFGDAWSCDEAAREVEATGDPGAAGFRYRAVVLRRREQAALTGRCDAGDAAACERMALTYENEAAQPARLVGRRLLYARARGIWSAHCGAGDAAACHEAARLWADGLGGDVDAGKASELERRACSAGLASACAAEARALLAGRTSTGPDPVLDARANDAFDGACKLGDAEACRELGWRVLYGIGAAASVTVAEELFVRACELGSDDACMP